MIITDECSRIASIQAQWDGTSITGSLTTFPGNNLWNSDTLGVLGIANNLPIGTTQVTYIVTDHCGNSSTCQFNLTVEDGTPPSVACDEWTKVALGADGMALVNAITFDDGSYDNCSPVHFKARRMATNNARATSNSMIR